MSGSFDLAYTWDKQLVYSLISFRKSKRPSSGFAPAPNTVDINPDSEEMTPQQKDSVVPSVGVCGTVGGAQAAQCSLQLMVALCVLNYSLLGAETHVKRFLIMPQTSSLDSLSLRAATRHERLSPASVQRALDSAFAACSAPSKLAITSLEKNFLSLGTFLRKRSAHCQAAVKKENRNY